MPAMIGYDMCHYALLETDDYKTGKATYKVPERIIGAITANINPNTSDETLFADNGPMESASALGKVELELGAADFPLDTQAILLGHKYNKGAIVRKGEDTPPWVAIGGRSLKSNGSYRYFWLLKGKMMEPEQQKETKKDKVDYQTPNMKGSFVMRDADGAWIIEYDEDDKDFNQTIVDNWFKTVPDPVTLMGTVTPGETGK